MRDIFFVAEIGCNHNGSVELAKKMIHEAKRCGATAVKFQKCREGRVSKESY